MSSDNKMGQLVCFKIKDIEFGVDIMKVQEIVRLGTVTSVPNSSRYLLGIVNLRGHVLPVINLKSMLSLDAQANKKFMRIIVLEISGKKIGVLVDTVKEVVRIEPDMIEELPNIANDGKSKVVSKLVKLEKGKRILSVIEFDDLLTGQLDDVVNEVHGHIENQSKDEKILDESA